MTTENLNEKPQPKEDLDLELLHRTDVIRNNLRDLHSVDLKLDMSPEEVGVYLSKILRISSAAKLLYYMPERFEKPIETLCNIADVLGLVTKHIGSSVVRLIRTKEETLYFTVELIYRLMTYEERKVLRDLTHLSVREEKLPDGSLRFIIETPLLDPLTFTDEVGKVLKLLLWIDEKEKDSENQAVIKRSVESFLVTIENSGMIENNVYSKTNVRYVQPLPADRSMWEFNGDRFVVVCVATLFKAPKESQRTLIVFQGKDGAISAVSVSYWNENFTKVAAEPLVEEVVQTPKSGKEYVGPEGEFVHIYDVVERKNGERIVIHGGREGEPQRTTPIHEFLGYKKV